MRISIREVPRERGVRGFLRWVYHKIAGGVVAEEEIERMQPDENELHIHTRNYRITVKHRDGEPFHLILFDKRTEQLIGGRILGKVRGDEFMLITEPFTIHLSPEEKEMYWKLVKRSKRPSS